MMYAQELLPQLEALARRSAEAEGVEVAWVEFKKQGGNWILRVYIDKPEGSEDGVSLGDCQRVSERLSVLLDVDDPIESAFTLEVSSPGLDRPLWTEKDYARFLGRAARIETREPIEGRHRFRGRLVGVDRGAVLLERDGERWAIPFPLIGSGRLEVELTPRPKVGKRS